MDVRMREGVGEWAGPDDGKDSGGKDSGGIYGRQCRHVFTYSTRAEITTTLLRLRLTAQ
jgi:hypothetical protein